MSPAAAAAFPGSGGGLICSVAEKPALQAVVAEGQILGVPSTFPWLGHLGPGTYPLQASVSGSVKWRG